MAIATRSPRSNDLIAVLLITRSKPGPKLVFHYPPDAQPNTDGRPKGAVEGSDSDSDSDEENGAVPRRKVRDLNESHDHNGNPPVKSAKSDGSNASGTVLGYSEEILEKLLSPGRWCDRKKFEICLDNLTFVGRPIYADEDEKWTKEATPRIFKEPTQSSTPDEVTQEGPEENSNINGTSSFIPTEPNHRQLLQNGDSVPQSFDSRFGASLATSMQTASSTSAVQADAITMFHVVFVLCSDGPASTSKQATDLYQHVAKKLSKALHHSQKQTSYVGLESRKLLALKAKARLERSAPAMPPAVQMPQTSELAWALKEIYDNISTGQVAGFRISGNEMSLQIPPAGPLTGTVTTDHRHAVPSAHSALLLLEDKDILLRALAGHPDATPLATFIREHTPTKSLAKHARNLGMPLPTLLFLARHLLKWRKATSIAPLHPRNIYAVSPTAPLDARLPRYVADYARRFAALPTLPQMLRSLSAGAGAGRPVKYGSFVPSRDHRAAYMDMLAYLVRHGFVAQVKTFGWLQVDAGAATAAQRSAAAVAKSDVNQNRQPVSVARLLSPQLRPVGDDGEDSASVSSERTAIPVSLDQAVASVRGRSSSSARSARTARRSTGTEEEEVVVAAPPSKRLILDPADLSDDDVRALESIRDSFDDEELRDCFANLQQHFDGKHVLEDIAALEELKRGKVEAWLELLQTEVVLVTYRSM